MAETMEQAVRVGLTWEEVCADPNLDDLPYKIETNEWGQIVMSPTRLKHGGFQAEIAHQLKQQPASGKVVTEAAVKTSKGTKVADVAWFSPERWEQVKDEFDASVAPEICVEVISPRNSKEVIEQKKRLYFEAGAQEVWICDDAGGMRFFTRETALDRSALASGFPKKVDV
jgi:Uma2 family endonuclease